MSILTDQLLTVFKGRNPSLMSKQKSFLISPSSLRRRRHNGSIQHKEANVYPNPSFSPNFQWAVLARWMSGYVSVEALTGDWLNIYFEPIKPIIVVNDKLN